ncbi:carboxypeptidase-like regulatory domain-containing protein [Hymenobacter cellulosilyticus]|uniref:Carboxypeptidase-like regulatory domain-containing protein n=1 Tax=Hymenobacter cellulosilyticus TaxID=2932248 RepID=A0A8T9Q4F3_9BACT|nr:carboxypeptidase-like regulatory domain-containing protein [Hymenobacter cellulosilyticus]UOQ71311.1 carboxypeptidase-like regulatory domain-containing protein [Hymenobacter cellulosilyticus]
MATSQISIPQPCAQPWASMSPTEAGRHCAVCATEVVDFTRLSEAEILAFLARQGGRPVCANAYATQLAPPPVSWWRRWALAGLALLGWQSVSSCATQPPQQPPTTAAAPAPTTAGQQQQPVVIRGQVLDGPQGPGVAGAFLFINDTQYGTVTDENGRFELVLASGWEPVRAGQLTLRVQGSPFTFKPKELPVKVAGSGSPIELLIQMESIEGRGQVMGKIHLPVPPVAPPKG